MARRASRFKPEEVSEWILTIGHDLKLPALSSVVHELPEAGESLQKLAAEEVKVFREIEAARARLIALYVEAGVSIAPRWTLDEVIAAIDRTGLMGDARQAKAGGPTHEHDLEEIGPAQRKPWVRVRCKTCGREFEAKVRA